MPGAERNLNLWKQHLGSVPSWVWQRTDLEGLVLADNDLLEVSESIGLMHSLRMLDLGHNRLPSVPATLGSLEGLSDYLYLHDNRLATLPLELARLTRLRYLNLSENSFGSLPDCVCAMTSLAELRISDNPLRSLPPEIGGLANLRELHLRNCRLCELPDAIAALPDLRHLDLRGNPLTALPAALVRLPRLAKLDLRWVDTLEPPAWLGELAERGCLVYL